MICALGWHQWDGGACKRCGKTRTCSGERHFWRRDRCEVCGSRKLGPAQIATLINKIHLKRFDSKLASWVEELTDVGPIAIRQILTELSDMERSHNDLPNAPFQDLRRVVENMGPRGSALLREAVGAEPGEGGGHSARVKKMAEEISAMWKDEAAQADSS